MKKGEVLKYDVLVVGAGPAGSTAARFASKNGARTLVIEKRQEIGSPVRCGEATTLSWLEEVEIEDHDRWCVTTVKGARIFFPGAKMLELVGKFDTTGVGIVIERDILDKDLAKLAIGEGAEYMLKTSAVSLIKEDGKVCGVMARSMGKEIEIRADIVIGADGFESQIGRWGDIYKSLPPEDIISCFQYRMAGLDIDLDFTYLYLGEFAPGGFVWVFPKKDNQANVGLGIKLSLIEENKTPKNYLDEFIASKEEFKKGMAIDMVAGGVEVGPPPSNVTADGLMLVGDASRVVNPITGGGVANGVRQGKIAGEVAAQCVREGRFDHDYLKEHYEARWRDLLENEIWRNYMIKEKLNSISGKAFAKLMETLSKVDLKESNLAVLLEAIQKENPEIMEELQSMF